MPAPLRFRTPNPRHSDTIALPRTPKSPRGVYSGEPVPAKGPKVAKRTNLKLAFGIISLSFLSLVVLFYCRHQIPLSSPLSRSHAHFDPPAPEQRNLEQGAETRASGPYQSLVPPFPTIHTTFQDDIPFQRLDELGDIVWRKLFPKGGGRLAVKHPRQYRLPHSVAAAVDEQGNAADDTEIYIVAAVKQLECLAFIRQFLVDDGHDHDYGGRVYIPALAFQCLDHGWYSGTLSYSLAKPVLTSANYSSWLRLVRQALLCAADTTLEPIGNRGALYPSLADAVRRSGDGTDHASGESLHTCKDWSAVKTWMEDNRLK